MENEYVGLLTGVSFLAGVIDSIAGGGGLLTFPMLLFSGVSPAQAIGTSKFFSSCGLSIASMNFGFKKRIPWKTVRFGVLFSLLGAGLGSHAILWLDPEWARVCVLVFLPMAALSLLFKHNDTEQDRLVIHPKPKAGILSGLMGFYDGFFGPGTGTFLTLGAYHILGLHWVHATAFSKPLNLASNLVAFSIFWYHGQIIWGLAIPMAISNMIGSWAGSHLVMLQGAPLVRRALLGVVGILFISLMLRGLKGC